MDSKPPWAVTRGTAIAFGLASLAFSLCAFYAAVTSTTVPTPDKLRVVSGEVTSVRYSHDKYGNVSDIHFGVNSVSSEFAYDDFFPAFPEVRQCMAPGAPVTLRVVPGWRRPDIWELQCRGQVLADVASISAVRRANGRAAMWVGVGFAAATLFWVWLLATKRTL